MDAASVNQRQSELFAFSLPQTSTSLSERTSPAVNTPMMEQYHALKREYPDCLLFFRLGDFYEMFFEDAITASRVLSITLTQRGKNQGENIPMCGVPFHAYENYLARLIRQGFRVAICEQLEDPALAKKRGHKAIVKRDVIRIVTPGTLTEDTLLEAKSHNFLGALYSAPKGNGVSYSLAAIDISTGDFFMEILSHESISGALARLNPSEIIAPESLVYDPTVADICRDWRAMLHPLPDSRFDLHNGRRRLEQLFKVATLDGFGFFNEATITAASALVDYIALTQKGSLPRLEPPRPILAHDLLAIDAATHRNLELTMTLTGERKGSLLATIDRTLTSAGARCLSRAMAAPLAKADRINQRLNSVAYFHENDALRTAVRGVLKHAPDIERSLSRLSLARGGPRDLAAIRDGLACAEAIKAELEKHLTQSSSLLENVIQALGNHASLISLLQRALHDSLPILARDGGFIAPGYSSDLDALVSLRDEGKKHIVALQTRYCAESGINSLKIRHNNIIGYHVDVTAIHAGKLPSPFIHRQTLANSMRYTTVELAELEEKIMAASAQSLQLELQLYEELASAILRTAQAISEAARALADMDMLTALAELAIERDYRRPVIDDNLEFTIIAGRHPVVETTLQEQTAQFISNDCALKESARIWLLTGPNMAGKSTFLRQNALIALMAHMGSFVPAASARIGVIDRIFSRVGAADDLARGRSTFMVEMVETAAILNQATRRSLVILDEVGRGTSTYDGMAIAWAAIEHLHNHNQCRTLFATHYHELTALERDLSHLCCYTMKIQEWEGNIVFLHKIIEGTANRSYGLHVAALAGLPATVIKRAEEILTSLEDSSEGTPASTHKAHDVYHGSLPLSSLETKLSALNLDDLTPRQALEVLYKLKSM